MKTVVGKVVSNKMTKSVVVAVQRLWQHPRYPKVVKKTSKFMAHDEANACNVGDEVLLRGSKNARQAVKHFGRAPGTPNPEYAKGHKVEKAHGCRNSRGFKV